MRPRPKFEVLPPLPRERDPLAMDAFHEDRIQQDLARFSRSPGLLEKYIERLRIRFQKSNERAVIERWIEFYQSGERLIAARTAMERQKSEFLQLEREHEVSERKKDAEIAKQEADIEEHKLRRDQAAYKRQHPELFIEGAQPPKPEPPQLSPEQQRRLKRMETEDRLEDLNKEETRALQKATSDLEKRRLQNMYAAKRDQLMEQMEKYL